MSIKNKIITGAIVGAILLVPGCSTIRYPNRMGYIDNITKLDEKRDQMWREGREYSDKVDIMVREELAGRTMWEYIKSENIDMNETKCITEVILDESKSQDIRDHYLEECIMNYIANKNKEIQALETKEDMIGEKEYALITKANEEMAEYLSKYDKNGYVVPKRGDNYYDEGGIIIIDYMLEEYGTKFNMQKDEIIYVKVSKSNNKLLVDAYKEGDKDNMKMLYYLINTTNGDIIYKSMDYPYDWDK